MAFLVSICYLAGCAKHVSDDNLISRFQDHPGAFQRLIQMADEDHLQLKGWSRYRFDAGVRNNYLADYNGLTKERVLQYKRLLDLLQIEHGMAVANGRIVLRVDRESIWNGDSGKGYLYSPGKKLPSLSSLDSYKLVQQPNGPRIYQAFRELGKGWYLFLYYNA